MVSVDGDTSTNDMVAILANGLAGNAEISAEGADFSAFREALAMVTQTLCKAIAKDGEGATRLITCKVSGAKTTADAKIAAKAVVSVQPAEGCYLWGRRQLGPCALRTGIQWCAAGRCAGGSYLCLCQRKHNRVHARRGRQFL